jgi:hypothetical protein
VYEAADAETIRKIYRTADVPFINVWAASPLHRSAGDEPA